tara:strand:+ start:332 stop:1300 length:969 start_codon:yes stop_codon:yes gene_type:complete
MSENSNKLFKSFIDDICEVFPEYKKRLMKYYQSTFDNDDNEDPKLKEFLDNIDEISEKIVNKDITVFEDDPVILQNVSFKLLWNSEGISDQTKNSIWKYLQTFCVINIQSESEEGKIKDVLKSIESNEKVKDKETLKNMKKLQKLNEQFDIQEIEKVIEENPDTVDQGMNEMDKMFENTSIGKIAKEITEDLDIENIVNNGGGIQDLFSGGNMANIMQTISTKMADKKGEMDTDNLMKEATNICSSMQGNPLFSSLLGMQGGVMESMMGGGNSDQPSMPSQLNPEQVRNINLSDKSHDPNKTKARLQKKLKEKQKTVVEKKS